MRNLNLQLLMDFSEIGNKIFPKNVVENGSFVLTDSVISGFIVVVAVLLVALILRLTLLRKKNTAPTGGQMFLEWLVCSFDKQAEESTERYASFMGPFTLGAAAYICCGVLIELFGLRPVMADLSACLALALCTFFLIHILGFVQKKHRRLLHYINPVNLVTDAAVPLSMTFRLFGSILSGMAIMDLVYILVEGILFAGIPAVLPAILAPVFTLFHAFIQSYVFAMLTLTFVGEAIEEGPRKPKARKRKKNKQIAV